MPQYGGAENPSASTTSPDNSISPDPLARRLRGVPKNERWCQFLESTSMFIHIFIFRCDITAQSHERMSLVFNNKQLLSNLWGEWHPPCKLSPTNPCRVLFGVAYCRSRSGAWCRTRFHSCCRFVILSFNRGSGPPPTETLKYTKRTEKFLKQDHRFPRIFGGSQCDFSGFTVQR